MAESSKTEGYTNTNDTERVTISCPTVSTKTYNFRLSQVTKETLSTAFGITDSIKFFLVDEDNNIEFASKDGIFDVTPNLKYKVEIKKEAVINNNNNNNNNNEQKLDINSINDLNGKELNISVAGNEDGRSTAIGFFITVHGSHQKDKRDGSTFYVIGHNDNTKKGIWKFHPFKEVNNRNNLYTIQLLTVSDGRGIGKGQWLAVHGSVKTDKRDNGSIYVLITPETHKATIWELIKCDNECYYIRIYGNKDHRKTGIGYLLSIHASNGNDKRDAASYMIHVRVNDHKATKWKIHT